MGQKNCEGGKTKKKNNSSGSKQLKVGYSYAGVLTTDEQYELKGQIDCDYPDIVCITEVKPKNFVRTLSLVECYINGYILQVINILVDEGRCMLLYIKKSIQYHLLNQFYIYKHVDPRNNNLGAQNRGQQSFSHCMCLQKFQLYSKSL